MGQVINMQEWFKKKKSDETTAKIIEQMKEIRAERTLHTPSERKLASIIKESSSEFLD